MPSLASGRSCCTAWASTWAAECRITLRPSSLSAPTGSTSTSASGAQARSRSRPSTSRTTTTALDPLVGRPASRTAAPAVVPAGTRTGADAGRDTGADTRASRVVRTVLSMLEGPDQRLRGASGRDVGKNARGNLVVSSVVPLSVLDLVPIGSGSTATAALENSTALVRRAEQLGFTRYWVAEHHGMPGIGSSSPAVLIAHLAAATSR